MQSIQQFFDSYALQILQFQAKNLIPLFEIPCLFCSDTTSIAYSEQSKLEGLFNSAIAFYKKIGVAQVNAQVWNHHKLSGNAVKAKVIWSYYKADGEELYSSSAQYILRRNSKDEWAINYTLSIDEQEKTLPFLNE